MKVEESYAECASEILRRAFPPTMFSDPTGRKPASILPSPALAVAAALALRFILLSLTHSNGDVRPKFQVVGLEAANLAWSLATGKGFSGPFPGYELTTAWLAPVYPFLWSIGFRIVHLDPPSRILIGQVLNCAFSAATCWPIFAIGKKLFGEKIGLASAWAWVFLPYAILMPLEWTWDQSLAALLLAWIVEATLALRESTSPLAWSGYGLLWGLAALVNPALCGLLPFLLGWLAFQRRQAGRKSVSLCARAIFMFVLSLLPWTIRNYYALDGWVFVKSNFGLELWLGNNPAVKNVYSNELHPIRSFPERLRLMFEGEPKYNKEKQHEAIVFIETHPEVFLKNTFDRFLDTWAATYDSSVDGWVLALHLSLFNIWFCSMFSALSLGGVILGLRANWKDSLPPVICLLIFPIPYYLTHTGLRYRHPIEPFLVIFAVYAVARMRSALSPASTPQTNVQMSIVAGA
jgi:4-amino-4-deoxy-L-arabinose transferase-like glycosyltransferase